MGIDSGLQPFEHLERAARLTPNAPALMSAQRVLTFAQLREHALKVASMLRAAGVRPGDVVAAQVPQDVAPVFALAICHEAAVGTVYPGPVGAGQAGEFDWLVTAEPAPGFPAERTITVDNEWLARAAALAVPQEPAREFPSRDSVCRVLYSSGTTGEPAGVPFSLRYLDARADAAQVAWIRAAPFMSLIGISSVVGLLTLHWCLATGQPYLCPGTTTESVAVAKRAQAAALTASPAQLADVVRELRRTGQRLDALKVAVLVGGVSSLRLELDFAVLTGARFVRSYASTEAGPAALQTEQGADPLDAGRIVEGMDVEVVDLETGAVLPEGVEGVLRIRRHGMPSAYYGPAGAVRTSLRDGWFYPGDLGTLTADGRLLLSGRSAHVLNVGGVKVDPARLDSQLHDAALVDDAAAFGFTSAQAVTALAVAAVCPRGTDFAPLVQAVTQMTGGVRPEVVHRVDSIPRTATGKVDRLALARDLEAAIDAIGGSPV